jgi:RhtB (resistance to homoserine/threonine) family protein
MAIRNSLVHSRAVGVYTAVGLALGLAVHVIYSLVGIAVLVSRSVLLFNAIKWLGAAYLIYIGVKALRARKHDPADTNGIEGKRRVPKEMSALAAVRSGFLTNLLNPKATLFVLALFTQVVSPETPLLAKGVYGLTAVSVELGWFALVALLISTGPIKRRFDASVHWVERLTGAVLVSLGLKLAFYGAGD